MLQEEPRSNDLEKTAFLRSKGNVGCLGRRYPSLLATYWLQLAQRVVTETAGGGAEPASVRPRSPASYPSSSSWLLGWFVPTWHLSLPIETISTPFLSSYGMGDAAPPRAYVSQNGTSCVTARQGIQLSFGATVWWVTVAISRHHDHPGPAGHPMTVESFVFQ